MSKDTERHHRPMSNMHILLSITNQFWPVAGIVLAMILGWNKFVDGWDIAVMLVLHFLIGGVGVSMGCHRYFSHRSFKTSRWFHCTLAVLGSLGAQASVMTWAADHRKHHRFSDEPGDPHSPHQPDTPGSGPLRALYHAHFGWLFTQHAVSGRQRYAPDLMRDPFLVFLDRTPVLWFYVSLLIPFSIGFAIKGTLGGALEMMVWAGLVRMFLNQHAAWAINSLGHWHGEQRFRSRDEARNISWLALLTFGDGFHHNHHVFPTSAWHGLTRREKLMDMSGQLIALCEKLGLVWDVRRVSRERYNKMLLEPPQS